MANDAKFNFYLNRTGPRGQKGEKGDQGFSPSITVNTNTADEYTLLIQNEYDSLVTDNIRPTYDDRGGTYVRVDRANNVQYFGSADIATTANYGEVKLAQASDLASTVDVGNSNVITVELLKTWFGGQVADNLVTTTNNVTIQGQKIFATPTRFMDTVRIGNRLMVTQDDTGTITFDTDETGTLIGNNLTSTGDARFMQNVTVDGSATITGQLNVKETPLFYKSIDVAGRVYAGGITILSGDIEVNGDIDATGNDTITKNVILSPGKLKRVNGFSSNLRTDTSEITPEEYITVGDERLPLRLVGTKVLTNGKDVATADTVEAMQSDLNIAKQDIIEAQGDIDNLQMNKQNKLTAGTGITIDADNVISATGGVVDLPIASSTTLGGIKVGENLTISEDGTLSATGGGTGDVSAAGNNTFTGENTFNGAVNLNGTNIAENLTVNRNLTSSGEINAVSIKTTGLRSDDIQTTTNKKYLTEVDVDNQTIQVVDGKLHANLDELGNEVNSLTGEVNTLSGEVAGLSGDVTTLSGKVTAVEGKTTDLESAVASKQDKLTAISPVNIVTKVLSPTEGWVVSSSSMQSRYKEQVANDRESLYDDRTTMHLTSDSEYPIKSYVAMPYSVGQVVKYRQNRSNSTKTTLVLGDIIDGKIYPILINSAVGDYRPQYVTALFDGTQELTKEVMTNGIKYSSSDRPGPTNQPFINEATFGCLQNTGTKLMWHVFTPRDNNHGDYGNLTYTNFNGYTIDDLVGKIKYAIILAGNTSLAYTPDQFGVYENTLSSYRNISDYQALSPNLFDLSKNEVQTQISTLPATTSSLGVVKPDGTTITITDDGTISAVGGGSAVEGTTLQQGTQFTLNLTGNGTLGGSTPACTGSSYENGHPYYYAFKGATSSTPTSELWGPSSGAGNQYLILDCVTPIALQSFRWTNGGNSQERFPVIVFKGSNDNSNYTTLGTYNTQNATDDSVTIENYTPYRYYRFDFPAAASYGKLGFISMSGFNRYNILNIGDGLDVINGQLTCTPSDAPVTGVSAPLKLSGNTVYVPEMTGNVTDGFTVTASRFSAEYSSQYYKCFNADGKGWYAGNAGSGSDYIQIVFPRLLHLRSAYIKQNGNANSLVSNYTLLITQNGTDWTEVLSDKLPQTVNYETSKIINSNCLGFRFRADGNYEPNGAAISGITLDLTELPTTATLAYDDNFELDSSNQLSLNSAKFGKLSSPILDVPVNNCILAMPTAPTFDGTNVKVYAGTKVAIANGLNADGTCKSNIVTLTTDATINQSTFNGDVTLMLKSDGTIDQTAYSYFEVDDISTITTLTAYCWYYDRKTNNHYLASSEGAKQGPYQRIKIGSYNQAEAATTKYFKIYKPIALEKLDITGSCMPDYTRPLTFTPNVVTTATFDCWLCGQFNVDQNKNSTIKFYNSAGTVIKGFDIASGSAYTNRRFHNIPLPKGTIYEVSLSTSSFDAYIYPCIGGMTNA